MSTAFLFAGQGSQKVGMGVDLAAACDDCRTTMTSADTALGFALTKIMAFGPEEELNYTGHTQPAILCLSVVQARHLQSPIPHLPLRARSIFMLACDLSPSVDA
jgi:[acyl-carrier-protein] S-malonyltransferase